jgi:hypothetical protein
MAHIVVLIAKNSADVEALAKVRQYKIVSDIIEFESLNKDALTYKPPYFEPPLGHVQTGQPGAIALAEA